MRLYTSRAVPPPSLTLAAVLLLCAPAAAPAAAPAQEDAEERQDDLGIDELFEAEEEESEGSESEAEDAEAGDAEEEGGEQGGEQGGEPAPAHSLLDRVTERPPVELRADVRFTGGYSPGWSEPLGDPDGEYADFAAVDLRSGIDLLFTVSPALSISQKLRLEYPGYDFEIAELALDYNIEETAFVTLGLKRVNWGRSPNFAFGNLPHRRADAPLGPEESENTIVSRVRVPVGIGGVELLVQNKDEYHEDPESPRGERVGVGARYNYARERLDAELGVYYQRGLAGRLVASGETTVTDWLELYAEGVAADDRLRGDETVSDEAEGEAEVEVAPGRTVADNNPDYGAAVGVVVGLFENTLDLNAEYYYSGEETEREVAGARFPLFWGHNLAFNADWRIPDSPLRLRAAYRYNHAARSSLLAPRLTVDLMRHVTLDFTGGVLWGPEDAAYRAENPDDADRPVFAAVTITVHGRIR